jgi:hypothetical protein
LFRRSASHAEYPPAEHQRGTASPTITVTGSGFSSRPVGNPGTNCGGTGDWYGTKFYFWEDTEYWEAGLSGDCIGIVIDSWSSHSIVFGFGNTFGTPGFTISNGDNYAFDLRTLLVGGVVSGLSA